MKPALLIISPEYPPARGGIADHTRRLATEFARMGKVSVLTSKGDAARSDSFEVHPSIADWSNTDELFVALESIDRVDVVLWQYVPHMYGHGGVNLKLPGALMKLQEHHRPQIVLAHEIAAPYSAWPHRFYYAWAHRSQWRRLLNASDAVGISTEAWIEEWKTQRPDVASKFFLAPSPSNIDVVDVPDDHAANWRAKHDLPASTRVLAYFGTLSEAKQFGHLTTAWEAAQDTGPTALVVIGGKPEYESPQNLASLYRPLGYLEPRAVSEALQATDVLALPFVDGTSERRTSFMAGLAHGCAVATTIGPNTGITLQSADWFASVPAEDAAGFSRIVCELLNRPDKRTAIGKAGAEAYSRDYDWVSLVQRIMDQLA